MNRTERAIIRSNKEAAASANRQKNDTIKRRNALIASKAEQRDIKHLSRCIKKDVASEKTFSEDIKLYKNRFAVQKKTAKEAVVA